MKRFFLLLLLALIACSCGPAKSVGYSHKILSAEGCSVNYSVVRIDDRAQIVVTIKSDRLVFTEKPTMLLKNGKGETLKLDGINADSKSETGGVLVNNVMIPYTELSAMALFPIGEESYEFFKSGIYKVRLTTIPIVHEKEFWEDAIGAYLYKQLVETKAFDEDF